MSALRPRLPLPGGRAIEMLKMRVGRIFAGGGPEFDLDDFSIEGCRTTSIVTSGL